MHGMETTRVPSPGFQRLPGGDGNLHLGAGADEDHPDRTHLGVGQHVTALGDPLGTVPSRIGRFCRVRARPGERLTAQAGVGNQLMSYATRSAGQKQFVGL